VILVDTSVWVDHFRHTELRLVAALKEIKPSSRAWLNSARNVVMFGADDGTYTELRAYLKKSRKW